MITVSILLSRRGSGCGVHVPALRKCLLFYAFASEFRLASRWYLRGWPDGNGKWVKIRELRWWFEKVQVAGSTIDFRFRFAHNRREIGVVELRPWGLE
jgi:hypothetical protein